MCAFILCIYEFKWNYPVVEERGPCLSQTCRLSDNTPYCKNRLSQFVFLVSEAPKQAVDFVLGCPPEFDTKALLLQTIGNHLF